MYTPDCQLTIKDVSILETMLQRHDDEDGAFVRLLRHKLATAKVVFRDAIDPRSATLLSRVEISVDGGPAETRILAYGGEDAFPGMALPITTIRGLSLLGVTAPGLIVCERADGATESVELRRVLHQPEAAKRSRMTQAAVVTLKAREPVPWPRHDPDGDDPGPQAA
jgi:regulator of nucleoside diphosphate kinase